MKILYYINSLNGGGAERVLSMLANAHSLRKEDVFIATNIKQPFAYSMDSNIHFVDLYEGLPDTEKTILDKLSRYCKKIKNIRRIATEIRPDVAISFLTDLNHDVIFALLGLRIPLICSEHTNVTHKLDKKTAICRRIMYPFASAITVLTSRDYKIWRKIYRNVVRMPNPCYCRGIKDFNNRNKTILAVGGVGRWKIKGFDNLLIAWSKICHNHLEWTLKIAGGGDQESFNYLNNLCREYNCINYEFLGFQKDVSSLLQASEVFVLSSRYEGLPMALVEAMDAGCCCVAFDVITGPSDIIKNEYNGLLAKNQDIDDLSLKLDRVLSDESLRKRLATRAAVGVEKFDIDKVITRWDVLIKKLIN